MAKVALNVKAQQIDRKLSENEVAKNEHGVFCLLLCQRLL